MQVLAADEPVANPAPGLREGAIDPVRERAFGRGRRVDLPQAGGQQRDQGGRISPQRTARGVEAGDLLGQQPLSLIGAARREHWWASLAHLPDDA